MAQGLTKAFNDQFGNSYASAYFVIQSIGADYVTQRANINVKGFKDSASFNAGKQPFTSFEYDFRAQAYQRDGDGFTIPAFINAFPASIQAGYGIDLVAFRNWLLTTPEFTGAT